MENYICNTCGVQYAAKETPPLKCIICEDVRQYVNPLGQSWTTLESLRKTHRNSFRKEEKNLYGIGTVPSFAIAQRALLIVTPGGNILWDCITLIDEVTIEIIKSFGKLKAIALSHPHYYSSIAEWSISFENVPVYIHKDDEKWITRKEGNIILWEGEKKELWDDISIIRTGGHFPGSSVLNWPAGANGKGVLLTGDSVNVTADRKFVSFMYSFPNLYPLKRKDILKIKNSLEDIEFDRIYSAWFDHVITEKGKSRVNKSVERYLGIFED
ncbi:MAG: MBL fold metallo-hydrolase [Ignavibacteriaceae bacterium]